MTMASTLKPHTKTIFFFLFFTSQSSNTFP